MSVQKVPIRGAKFKYLCRSIKELRSVSLFLCCMHRPSERITHQLNSAGSVFGRWLSE